MTKRQIVIATLAALAGIAILVALASGGQTPANQSVAISETINE